MGDTEREKQRHRQKEKQTPCREPNMGPYPGIPGSHPELKADTQPLSHPGVPLSLSLSLFLRYYLFIHERHREREAETQAVGKADSLQGAQCKHQSQDPKITT